MPQYALLVTGEGQGCDEMLACNKDFMLFEADDMEDAEVVAAAYIRDHGLVNIAECTVVQCQEVKNLDLTDEIYEDEDEDWDDNSNDGEFISEAYENYKDWQ